MISRITLGSLLLALLIPSGMAVWLSGHRDSCARFLAGDRSLPPSQMVAAGTQMVEVPCTEWLPRQSMWIQILCLVELVVVMVFVLHAVGDWRERRRMRGE